LSLDFTPATTYSIVSLMPLKYVYIEALASMRNRIYKSIFGLTITLG
jgi:hypothetical protein